MPAQLATIFPSAARTATPTAVEVDTYSFSGIILIVDVTAIVTTPSITVTVSGIDPLSGKAWTILASAAITTVSTTVLEIFPGSDETANLSENAYLPHRIRVSVTHGDADSITYSVTAHLLP